MPSNGQNARDDVDVVVVGGGSAGIAATRHLQAARPDLAVQLFEAGPRLGGRARTDTVGPGSLPLDLGCGWLHGARDNAWARIAIETGFALDDHLAPWDGAPRDLGLSAADTAEAEAAIERFFAAAEQDLGPGPDVSMATLLEPGSRWNGMLDAIGTYINGVELDRASLADYRRYAPGRGPDRRVTAGYGTLVETTGANLPAVCNTAVRHLDHTGSRLRLDTDRGTCTARVVIVTVSTAVLAGGALRFDPALPDKIEAATALPLGIDNKLFLGIPEGLSLAPESHLFGSALRSRTASYHIRPFGRPVIECYFGGELARDAERDPEAAVAFTRDEIADHLGSAVARRLTPLARSAWGGAPWIGGAYSYAVPGAVPARGRLAAPVDDRLFFAGEACSPHRFSTAHGAFETGVAAAEAVVTALGTRRD